MIKLGRKIFKNFDPGRGGADSKPFWPIVHLGHLSDKNSHSNPVGDFTVSITWSVATNGVTFWLPYRGKCGAIKEKAMAI